MSAKHVHDLRPDAARPGVHQCSSCWFACTAKAVGYVQAHPEQHRAIKRVKGRKQKVWDRP